MTVEMERMFTSVVIVNDDVDYLISLEDKGVGVNSIDIAIICECASRHNAVESGDFWLHVADSVEEGTSFLLVFEDGA